MTRRKTNTAASPDWNKVAVELTQTFQVFNDGNAAIAEAFANELETCGLPTFCYSLDEEQKFWDAWVKCPGEVQKWKENGKKTRFLQSVRMASLYPYMNAKIEAADLPKIRKAKDIPSPKLQKEHIRQVVLKDFAALPDGTNKGTAEKKIREYVQTAIDAKVKKLVSELENPHTVGSMALTAARGIGRMFLKRKDWDPINLASAKQQATLAEAVEILSAIALKDGAVKEDGLSKLQMPIDSEGTLRGISRVKDLRDNVDWSVGKEDTPEPEDTTAEDEMLSSLEDNGVDMAALIAAYQKRKK